MTSIEFFRTRFDPSHADVSSHPREHLDRLVGTAAYKGTCDLPNIQYRTSTRVQIKRGGALVYQDDARPNYARIRGMIGAPFEYVYAFASYNPDDPQASGQSEVYVLDVDPWATLVANVPNGLEGINFTRAVRSRRREFTPAAAATSAGILSTAPSPHFVDTFINLVPITDFTPALAYAFTYVDLPTASANAKKRFGLFVVDPASMPQTNMIDRLYLTHSDIVAGFNAADSQTAYPITVVDENGQASAENSVYNPRIIAGWVVPWELVRPDTAYKQYTVPIFGEYRAVSKLVVSDVGDELGAYLEGDWSTIYAESILNRAGYVYQVGIPAAHVDVPPVVRLVYACIRVSWCESVGDISITAEVDGDAVSLEDHLSLGLYADEDALGIDRRRDTRALTAQKQALSERQSAWSIARGAYGGAVAAGDDVYGQAMNAVDTAAQAYFTYASARIARRSIEIDAKYDVISSTAYPRGDGIASAIWLSEGEADAYCMGVNIVARQPLNAVELEAERDLDGWSVFERPNGLTYPTWTYDVHRYADVEIDRNTAGDVMLHQAVEGILRGGVRIWNDHLTNNFLNWSEAEDDDPALSLLDAVAAP